MAVTNMRTAYGQTLVELCETNKNIVVLDADLCGSTQGKMVEVKFPEQHVECGIAEADMACIAGGLARVGKTPFINSFAVFAAGRAYDQIRQSIGINKLNVKICGSSAGFSDFGDGATHQSIDDLAYMRVIPGMAVIVPADANETAAATRYMANNKGPMYLRVCRNDVPNVTPEGAEFKFGQPTVMVEGTDVTVFACGVMVEKCMKVAEALKGEISVKVVNVSTLKPLNDEKIIELAKGTKGVVTVEEHSVINGLGSAIAGALRLTRTPIEFVGAPDIYGSSAHTYEDILNYAGLNAAHIEEAIRAINNL